MEIKGKDLHYLRMSVQGEVQRQREFIKKYTKRLQEDGIFEDQTQILKNLRLVQKRLRSEGFCLALPFGVGEHVFVVRQYEDESVSFVEVTVDAIIISSKLVGELDVCFHAGSLQFSLADYEKTVFLSSQAALDECIRLSKGNEA